MGGVREGALHAVAPTPPKGQRSPKSAQTFRASPEYLACQSACSQLRHHLAKLQKSSLSHRSLPPL